MKILIACLTPLWTPHFETELELIMHHQAAADEVFVLTDPTGMLDVLSNPQQLSSLAFKARQRLQEGLRRVGVTSDHIIPISNKVGEIQRFLHLEELKNFTHDGVDVGMGVAANLISLLRDHGVDVTKHERLLKVTMQSALATYETFIDLLKRFTPDVVYLFNGRFAQMRPIMRVCEERSILFYTHERGASPAQYALHKNCLPHSIESAKIEIARTWQEAGDDKIAQATKWFVDRRNGVEQSWISHVKQHDKQRLPVGFDRTKKNIVIFNSSMDEYESIPEWRSKIYPDENKGIARMVSDCPMIHFYLRVHPHLAGVTNAQTRAINQLNFPNLTIIGADEPVDSYALAEASDSILVFSSTMGPESCFWRKPAIIVGRAFYEDLGCCYRPATHEQVLALLTQRLTAQEPMGALMYAYWLAHRGIPFTFFKPDGLFGGTFLGAKIEPELNFADWIRLKIYLQRDQRRLEYKVGEST